MNTNHSVVTISTATIFKIIAVVIILVILFFIADIIGLLFAAFIIASAISPWVNFCERHKIPRSLGVLALYIVGLGVVAGIAIVLIPLLTFELKSLATQLPDIYSNLYNYWAKLQGSALGQNPQGAEFIRQTISSFNSTLGDLTTSIFSTVTSFVGGMAAFVVILVIAFYLSVDKSGLRALLRNVAPESYQPYLNRLLARIQNKMGGWLRGQLLLSAIIFALVFIGLSIMGVPYALVFALVAGIFEIIPFLGPILGALLPVLFAFTISPTLALMVAILFFVVQQLENHLIVPKVMSMSTGLNPVVILLVILVGAKLGGILGALLAVPIATVIAVFLEDFFAGDKNSLPT